MAGSRLAAIPPEINTTVFHSVGGQITHAHSNYKSRNIAYVCVCTYVMKILLCTLFSQITKKITILHTKKLILKKYKI